MAISAPGTGEVGREAPFPPVPVTASVVKIQQMRGWYKGAETISETLRKTHWTLSTVI